MNNLSGLMIFREENSEFDFNSIKSSDKYQIMAGTSVKIDRILRNITGETVVGVSGTMTLRGVKLRCVWDYLGNIVEVKKMFKLFSNRECDIQIITESIDTSLFNLVKVDDVPCKKSCKKEK